jgi:hypothetical protein
LGRHFEKCAFDCEHFAENAIYLARESVSVGEPKAFGLQTGASDSVA